MTPADATKARAEAYRLVVSSAGWHDVLMDLGGFAAVAQDPAVRAGRQDVILRLLRMPHAVKEATRVTR